MSGPDRVVRTAGNAVQVLDDARHPLCEIFNDVDLGFDGFALALGKQQSKVVQVMFHGRERLVQFVTDARRHLAESRQLAGLNKFALGLLQLVEGAFALDDFLCRFSWVLFSSTTEDLKISVAAPMRAISSLPRVGIGVERLP